MTFLNMDKRFKISKILTHKFIFLLLFASVALLLPRPINGFGYDSANSCSPNGVKTSRRGRAQMLAAIPCDLTRQGYCTDPGSAYPWNEVRRFVHENQGLMRRMYGDGRLASILREEIQNNAIDFDDIAQAAERYTFDNTADSGSGNSGGAGGAGVGGRISKSMLHNNREEYAKMSFKSNDNLKEPYFRPVTTTTMTAAAAAVAVAVTATTTTTEKTNENYNDDEELEQKNEDPYETIIKIDNINKDNYNGSNNETKQINADESAFMLIKQQQAEIKEKLRGNNNAQKPQKPEQTSAATAAAKTTATKPADNSKVVTVNKESLQQQKGQFENEKNNDNNNNNPIEMSAANENYDDEHEKQIDDGNLESNSVFYETPTAPQNDQDAQQQQQQQQIGGENIQIIESPQLGLTIVTSNNYNNNNNRNITINDSRNNNKNNDNYNKNNNNSENNDNNNENNYKQSVKISSTLKLATTNTRRQQPLLPNRQRPIQKQQQQQQQQINKIITKESSNLKIKSNESERLPSTVKGSGSNSLPTAATTTTKATATLIGNTTTTTLLKSAISNRNTNNNNNNNNSNNSNNSNNNGYKNKYNSGGGGYQHQNHHYYHQQQKLQQQHQQQQQHLITSVFGSSTTQPFKSNMELLSGEKLRKQTTITAAAAAAAAAAVTATATTPTAAATATTTTTTTTKQVLRDGQLFQDTIKQEAAAQQPAAAAAAASAAGMMNLRGVNACPVKEEVVAPFWANNTRGEVLALLNLYPFEQYVHWEKCTHEHKQMYCREGCRCEQQYRLHRLLAYDPHNECRGIFSDWFRFPSCCICKCYNIPTDFRATSRSPRSEQQHFNDMDLITQQQQQQQQKKQQQQRHPVDLAEEELKKAIYQHASEHWYRQKTDYDYYEF